MPRRRSFEDVTVGETAEGFTLTLDGKPLRTPARASLSLPSRALAEAVAAEWRRQGPAVKPMTMPLTRLASTAIDRVAPRRAEVVAELLRYAGTDLLCYRAEGPGDLVERQEKVWQPVLDWAEARLSVALKVTRGIMPVGQEETTLAILATWLDTRSAFELTAVHVAAAATGSLVLAMALAEGRLSAGEAFAISSLDETYEIEQWGEDEEAKNRRRGLEDDVALADLLLKLISEKA